MLTYAKTIKCSTSEIVIEGCCALLITQLQEHNIFFLQMFILFVYINKTFSKCLNIDRIYPCAHNTLVYEK